MKRVKYLFLLLIMAFTALSLTASDLPEQAMIPYSSSLNFRQGYNDCGPFSAKAMINAVRGQNIPVKELKSKMKWRLKNNYSLPPGLEGLLKKYSIKIKTIKLGRLSDEQKIVELKRELCAGKPIILLIGVGKYQHYITLLGYDQKGFIIYDSLLKASPQNKIYTVDLNGALPGNNRLGYKELLNSWSMGGMYGFYEYYGIVGSNKKSPKS